MLKKKFLKKYGREAIYPMSAIRDENIFRSFLKGKHFKTIIETGTYKGFSTLLLSEYADNVVTFDVREYPEAVELLDVKPNIRRIIIKNDAEKAEILKDIDFDFAFIDGNHSHGIMIDFELLKGCDKLLFHDYHSGFPEDNLRTKVIRFCDAIECDTRIIREPFCYIEGIK